MAPPHQQKRKRGDRNYSSDAVDRARPSPHRPENLSLAQQNGVNGRGGGRRPSRGGRGAAQASPTPAPAAAAAAPPARPASPSPAVKTANAVSAPTAAPVRPAQPTPAPRSVPEVPAMQFPAPGSAPQPDPSAYLYTFITPEQRESWQEKGRQSLVEDVLARAEAEEYQELGIFFQEMLHLVTEGLINPSDAGALVKEILDTSSKAEELDLASLFLDTVAVCLGPQYASGKEDTGKELGINRFLHATGIDNKLVCTLLDEKLLMALRIVRGTFDRMGIRHSTNVLYRQSGFNLLREESEGYSKLMTEFFTVTHNFKPDKDTVEKTWEKVKALIGAFDLDVGRVLDITLDAFANNLIKHNKFFIRLLRYSDFWPKPQSLTGFDEQVQGLSTLPPWSNTSYTGLETLPEDAERIASLRHGRDLLFWDRVREVGTQAFFELGGRRAMSKEEAASFLDALRNQEIEYDADEKTKEKRKREEEADLWATRTNTFPPQGNSIAAQILGFKLRFYASEARNTSDRLSINLIWLAALLIKIGFISLKDLYPHIYPTDDKMAELKVKLEKEKAERFNKLKPGAGVNALSAAGALSEGEPHSAPIPRALQDAKAGSRTPLRASETAGATPAGSTPTQTAEAAKSDLPEPEDQKIILLRSLLLIGAIPDALYILGRFPWLLDVHDDLPKYINRLLHHMLSRVYANSQPLRGRTSDREPGSSRIEVNNTPLLEGRKSPKSIAWGNLEKTEWSEGDYGTSYRFYWDEWNDLVPVCETVDDVFTLSDTLLNMVGHKIGRDAELLTKLIRIGVNSLKDDHSPENVARWQKLSKRTLIPALSLTKSDPGIVNEAWELIRFLPTQVRYNMYSEWYGGQTSRMPDMKTAFELSRIFTKDVLKRISKTNIRDMARALAKVSYPSPGIALATGLQQIESYNNLIDTLIECIRYFTNIGFDVLIWQLLNSLGGGSRDRMQADGMILSKWLQRLAEFTGKVSKRYYKEVDIKPILLYIRDRLNQGDSAGLGVLGQMILSMGGIHSDQNWSEEQVVALAGRPTLRGEVLKRVGDRRHEVKRESARLVHALTSTSLAGDFLILIAQERQQYLERPSSSGAPIKVLSTNLTGLQAAFVQYLEFLRSNYSIEEFDSVVPALEDLIGTYRIEPAIAFTIMRPSIQHRMEQVEKTVDATKTPMQRPAINGDVEMKDATSLKARPTPPVNGEKEANEGEDVSMAGDSQPGTPAATTSASTGSVHPVLQSVIDRLNGVLEPGFEDRMSMLFYVRFWQSNLADLVAGQYDEELKNVRNARVEVNNDRTDMSMKGQKDKAAKRAQLTQIEKDLSDERRMATRHKIVMAKTFTSERLLWFPPEAFGPSKHGDLTNAIVQDCILPRIVMSEMDALFTAKFLFMVQKMNTPGFRTVKIMARLFSEQQFVATLFMLTEREARNLGIFMKEVLSQLMAWRDSKVLYDREGAGSNNDNPGFARILRDDNTVDAGDANAAPLSHADYQRLLYKWHNFLYQAIIHCLSSKEFMHIRNAIFFVKQVHTCFPKIVFHGNKIMEQVQKLAKEEERDDLKLSAASLLGDLQKMKKVWLIPQAFRSGENQLGTPDAGTPRPSLNAEAKEFKPKDGSAKDEEDGEIEDEKDAEKKPAAELEDKAETPVPAARVRAEETQRASTPSAVRLSPAPPRSDARPATPASASTPLTRQDTRTPASHGPLPMLPGGLPARPQGPLPPHRDLHRRPEAERTPSRHEHRPEEQQGRPDRPADPSREPLRRRSRSPGHRSRNRTPEPRLPRHEGERREAPPLSMPPRDAFDLRDPRAARPPRDSRDDRHRLDRDGRRHEAEPGPFPPASADSRDRATRPVEAPARNAGPAINPERAAMIPGMNINPERAALFAQDVDRSHGEDRRHDRGRRGQSPPRTDARTGHAGSRGSSPRRGDRVGPERPPPRSGPRDRRDEPSAMPPAPESHRGRNELFPGPSRNAPIDPSHGRLTQPEPRPQQDPNYGRLNAPTAPDSAPSGPRSRAGQPRGIRTGAEPSSTPSGPRSSVASSSPAVPPPSSPAQERAPPSGPAGGGRRATGTQPSVAPTTAPQGPAADSSSSASGIHPSRLQNIPALPQVQTNVPTAPASTAAIPSGPRSGGHRSTPSQSSMPAPSPTGRFPPTGPSSAGGSMRGGRSALGLINGVLQSDQQAPRNPSGTSVRGRGSIGGSGSQQGSAPQSPTIGVTPSLPAQSMLPPGPVARSDSLADRVDRPIAPGSEDSRGSRRSSGTGSRDEGGGRRRHGRSKSRSPRRDAADNAMRQSGDLPPRNGAREESSRRRESSDRDSGHRDRRSRGEGSGGHGRERERDRAPRDGAPREGRDSRAPSRNEGRSSMGMQGQQMGSFGGPPAAPPHAGMNGDMRGGPGGGGRRDDRDRREDGGRGGGRDGSKRRRPDEGPPGGPGIHDQKRRRP